MSHRSRLHLLSYLPALFAPLVILLVEAPSPGVPAPVPRKPSVEVVFCLDTTGSMSGLIEGAKLKIWSLCNQILNGRPMPNLRVGLVAFRDKGDDYVTRIYDLRDDLDEVYADLRTFTANGGGDTPEHVNQALFDAVHKVHWSEDSRALKIIFLVGDAPPHMDYNDDVKYMETCKKAVGKGILINAIQCGTDNACEQAWKDVCERAAGAFVAIPQGGGVRGITTPFDRRLGEINSELVRTTMIFGDGPKREADAKKAQLAGGLPAEVAADRAGYLAKEGKVARYDLIDTIRAGKIRLETLRPEELPAELQKMTPRDRQDHLERTAQQRTKLLREAYDLDRQRSTHITRELSRNKDSFDGQVLEMLRKQASRRIRY